MNKSLLFLSLLGLIAACGGKLTVDRDEPGKQLASGGATSTNLGGSPAAGSASSATGGLLGEAGFSSVGAASTTAGTASVAGEGPLGGTSNDNGGDGASGAAATAGEAGSAGAPSCLDAQDLPGDCHSCNGALDARRIDQSDIPSPANPCLAGTCNALGKPGSEPREPGATCHDDTGAVMCDGSGRCVQCLKSEHCPPNQYCAKGGSCSPTPCTDLDCGGACPVCETGKKCLADSDCKSGACDADTHACVDDHCKDHHQNFGETDADCGVTGNCGACKTGQGCYWNIDCLTNACDAISQTCITNQCADHHVDGDETDVDCGGGTCAGCPNYKKCKSSFDCADGLCSLSLPHLCTP